MNFRACRGCSAFATACSGPRARPIRARAISLAFPAAARRRTRSSAGPRRSRTGWRRCSSIAAATVLSLRRPMCRALTPTSSATSFRSCSAAVCSTENTPAGPCGRISGCNARPPVHGRHRRRSRRNKKGWSMRWLKFTANGQTSWGTIEGDRVIAVNGDPFGEWQRTPRTHSLAEVKIELPLMPRTFYCVGLNYLKHLKEAADKRGEVPNVPDRPEIGYRAQNALIAHDENVVIPATATEKIHYEGELAVVIGKKAKHLTEADAMGCVFGYTIGNDVSERTWQKADRGLWRAKNADTFKPMGPWIETDVDLDKMETVIRVNGKETGRFHTNDMIFGIVPFIVELTKYFTLWPGDVIWMGTDGASPDIRDGDVVEIDITGIGTLRNKFVAEKV